jgi:hypothetical protein
LIIAELFNQRFAAKRGQPLVEFAQLRPGKNNAVTVSD